MTAQARLEKGVLAEQDANVARMRRIYKRCVAAPDWVCLTLYRTWWAWCLGLCISVPG